MMKIYMRCSPKKLREYQKKNGRIYVYHQHNVDYYPSALFLRNWAIAYLNEAMKQMLGRPKAP